MTEPARPTSADAGATRGERQASAARERGLLSATWRALGTGVQLVVADRLDEARVAVEDVLERVDRAASRFRPDSELMRLRPDVWTEVSPLFAHAIAVARDAAAATDGLVDPTLGGRLGDLGYDRTFSLVVKDGAALPAVPPRSPGGWRGIAVAGTRVRVPAGLDLGATAKGLAADLAAAAAGGVSGQALVSLGGDIATAGDQVWPVLVSDTSDPDSPDPSGQVIDLRGCLATSGTATRRWVRGGQLVHHLLDPRTRMPVQGRWQTVSVVAATCVLANTASTAAVVLGDGAVAWLEERSFSARLVAADGTVRAVGGWPEQEDR